MSDCVINTTLFGFFKDIENNYIQIISKLKEENDNLKKINEYQEQQIKELYDCRQGDGSIKEISSDTVSNELVNNNKYIQELDEQLTNYKQDIQSRKVLIYKTESFNSEFQIKDLIGKIIGKDGSNLWDYKFIIGSILGGESYHQENNIRILPIKSKYGEHFILIKINISTEITDRALSEIRFGIREKMKEKVDLPYINKYPPIKISCPLILSEEEILKVLNSSESVSQITEFLIRENGTSKDNILELYFSDIIKNSNTKIPDYTILLSVKVKYLIYKKEFVSHKSRSVHGQIREQKKTNILKSLKREVQGIIDNHTLSPH